MHGCKAYLQELYFNVDYLLDVFAPAFKKGNLKLIDVQAQFDSLLIRLVIVNYCI